MFLRCIALVTICVALALGGGCKNSGKSAGKSSGGPVTVCIKSFVRCRLPQKGPLGVCTPKPCPPGKKRPCFKCMPQH